jgi:hypothetical protein
MGTTATEAITETAWAFFAACETGKGWAGCSRYCRPDASFTAQAEPIADLHTLEEYAEWMERACSSSFRRGIRREVLRHRS